MTLVATQRSKAVHHRLGARSAGLRRHAAAGVLALPLAVGLIQPATPAHAAVAVAPFGLAATPLTDGELAALRGGFRLGAFDLSVGIVARSVIDQALGGLGERLEVVSRFTVPAAGRIAHAGTTVQALADETAGGASTATTVPAALAAAGVAVSTTGATTTIDIGGTTRLAQHVLNTFVENADVNRVIANQLDINLKVGGVARQLSALRAVRALRPAVEAQIFYATR
jgi:hypothetical protein